MKALFKIKTIVTLFFFISFLSCSDDDSSDDNSPLEYPESYVEFNLEGPIMEGEYEYIDASETDEFNTTAILYPQEEDPDIEEDQLQLYVGKSYTESNAHFTLPNALGAHTISYEGGANDMGVTIVLGSIEENYYAQQVFLTIDALELDENYVTHCKGSFSGTFYRNNLVEADLHTITGTFEINQ